MNCPVCPTSTLVMSERQGVEIDYCPKCRGVWLDRGELDKILEKAVAEAPASTAAPVDPLMPPAQAYPPSTLPPAPMPPQHYGTPVPPQPYGHGGVVYVKHKKKKSFLDDIFDFD